MGVDGEGDEQGSVGGGVVVMLSKLELITVGKASSR